MGRSSLDREKSHTTGVRSREEMEDLEEEKRLAEEERKLKENLRQKVRTLFPSHHDN